MTTLGGPRYALDANVLMTAHHHYYAPDICPGFWALLDDRIANGQLVIVDRVYDEVLSPAELATWVQQTANDYFPTTATQPIVDSYRQLMDWVQENPQFTPTARVDFARGADGWLAAYCMTNDTVVVTNEVSAPDAKRRVPLPNLCDQFGIRRTNTFDMLRDLGARFDWQRS